MRTYPTQAPQSPTSSVHYSAKASRNSSKSDTFPPWGLDTGCSLFGALILRRLDSSIPHAQVSAQKPGLTGLITLFKTAFTLVPAQLSFPIALINYTLYIFLIKTFNTTLPAQ